MTLIGQTIRDYHILDDVASGGFSQVYRAKRLTDGAIVAIKRIDTTKVEDGTMHERFKIESVVVAELNHPHILPIYDHWDDGDDLFMVMKWMAGGSLRRYVDEGGIHDLSLVTRWVSQIGSALQATHQRGLIHRDVKPDNIMFDEERNAYLADFGLAKDTTRTQPLTQMGWQLGSQAYASPEQISNTGELSPQSDIFAFGVTLFETLTGHHPFIEDSSDRIKWMVKALREPMPQVHELIPDIPVYVDAILQKATAKEPADRYASVQQMADDFTSHTPPLNTPQTDEAPTASPDDKPQSKGLLGRLFGRKS